MENFYHLCGEYEDGTIKDVLVHEDTLTESNGMESDFFTGNPDIKNYGIVEINDKAGFLPDIIG